jgi:5-methylcytosine-specific restriction endonuclease McrA
MSIQREELLDELRRVSKIAGRSPTEQDMLTHGEFAYSTYFRYFDSWSQAKSIAGVGDTGDKKMSDGKLLRELKRIDILVDGSPTRREVDRLGEYPSSTYKYRFGSWNEALREAGLPLNQHSSGGGQYEYGPEWDNRRRRVLERDGHQCRVCERTSAVLDNSLHVHHIRPLKEFEQDDGTTDSKSANRMENLVTLCPSCHRTYEGKHREYCADEFVRLIRESGSHQKSDI